MDKPEALLQRLERLGQDSVGNYGMPICAEAADELRRLHDHNQMLEHAYKSACDIVEEQDKKLAELEAVNAELLGALKTARPYVSATLTETGEVDAYHAELKVDIAIAKAEGEKT